MKCYLRSKGLDILEVVESGNRFLGTNLKEEEGKKKYENNAKAIDVILEGLDKYEFVKVIQYEISKEMWDKMVNSYEWDTKVKNAKIQACFTHYENMKMHKDESVANFFLGVDEMVNTMKGLGDNF